MYQHEVDLLAKSKTKTFAMVKEVFHCLNIVVLKINEGDSKLELY